MPNDRLYSNDKKKYKDWLKGYVIQILRLIVVFNYFSQMEILEFILIITC